MAYDLLKALQNPTYNRAEWRAFLRHSGLDGGTHYHFIGKGVENSAYAISVESEERRTIDQNLPTVKNTPGGFTFPLEFPLTPNNPAHDMIMASGLLQQVNEEYDALLVYANLGVKEDGTRVPDACFAQSAKVKITVSSLGGAGGEESRIISEIRTTGDITSGYVELGTDSANYDPDEETWTANAFTSVPTLKISDIFTITAA
ncbi:MAG: hypothetical protein FWF99_00065 [Desulfovibrionaceae bacterium]|nr:hypothetical protein [Desulfovibrionaceae bacterium]